MSGFTRRWEEVASPSKNSSMVAGDFFSFIGGCCWLRVCRFYEFVSETPVGTRFWVVDVGRTFPARGLAEEGWFLVGWPKNQRKGWDWWYF